jgi:hypothetical protein
MLRHLQEILFLSMPLGAELKYLYESAPVRYHILVQKSFQLEENETTFEEYFIEEKSTGREDFLVTSSPPFLIE